MPSLKPSLSSPLHNPLPSSSAEGGVGVSGEAFVGDVDLSLEVAVRADVLGARQDDGSWVAAAVVAPPGEDAADAPLLETLVFRRKARSSRQHWLSREAARVRWGGGHKKLELTRGSGIRPNKHPFYESFDA